MLDPNLYHGGLVLEQGVVILYTGGIYRSLVGCSSKDIKLVLFVFLTLFVTFFLGIVRYYDFVHFLCICCLYTGHVHSNQSSCTL